MTLDQLDQLIKKYLAMGVTVVIVLTGGPNTGTSNPSNPSTSSSSSATTSGAPPSAVTIDPNAPASDGAGTSGTNGSGGNGAADRSNTSDTTGAGGTDPSSADTSSGTPGTGTPSTGTNRSGDTPQTGNGNGGSGAGSAATKHNWGTPTRTEDFANGTGGWSLYDGAGHGGKGRRSPSAAKVANGILTITGSTDGPTEGMAWNPGQKYGRWEARVKSPAGDGDYHPVLLLWPDAENWPTGGEVDFMDFFLHYSADNQQKHGNVKIDATQWHDWAVEWTPQGITAYLDGNEWWKTTDTSILPPGPMHMTIQLDWFPSGGTSKESSMQVDWVRRYAAAGG
jgi:Glycosyl hydrolases family 16